MNPVRCLLEGLPEATALLEGLDALGLGIDRLAETLEKEGVAKFEASWRRLLEALEG